MVNPITGGIVMDSKFFWEVFLDTGAPEMFVYYQEAKRSEEAYVSDSAGVGSPCNTI